MKIKTKILISMCLALVLTLIIVSTTSAAGDIVIVANPEAGVDSLSKSDLESIMLGKKKKWDSGTKIKIAILKAGDTHEAFTKEYTGKTASQFKSYWKKLVFTGEGIQPKSFKTEDELVAYVAKTKGAVGYISSGTGTDGVTSVTIQ
jgi:ABC-type phosphate transport system substrate-binding protein